MPVSLEDQPARLPGDRRAKLDARAAELIAGPWPARSGSSRRPSRAWRSAAAAVHVAQLVEDMGGQLDLLATFPDRPRAPEGARHCACAKRRGGRKDAAPDKRISSGRREIGRPSGLARTGLAQNPTIV